VEEEEEKGSGDSNSNKMGEEEDKKIKRMKESFLTRLRCVGDAVFRLQSRDFGQFILALAQEWEFELLLTTNQRLSPLSRPSAGQGRE